MRDVRILIMTPQPNDVCSFYRGWGPMARLRHKIDVGFHSVKNTEELIWNYMLLNDILFLQRPSLPEHIKMAELAKDHGVPIWLDFDDNLLEVPKDNPTHEIFESRKKNIVYLLSLADVVTVTTRYLAKRWEHFNPGNFVVIPNAWDDYLYPMDPNEAYQKPNKVIFWRGSPTHQLDLMEARDEILKAAKQHPDYHWVFSGYNPWFITNEMPKSQFTTIPMGSMFNYVRQSKQLKPNMHIVPLADNPFNLSKSNIAFLEGTYFGANVIAPEMPEWPTCHYSKQITLSQRIQEMIETDWHEARLKKSRLIMEDLMLSKVNDMRVDLINELLGRKS